MASTQIVKDAIAELIAQWAADANHPAFGTVVNVAGDGVDQVTIVNGHNITEAEGYTIFVKEVSADAPPAAFGGAKIQTTFFECICHAEENDDTKILQAEVKYIIESKTFANKGGWWAYMGTRAIRDETYLDDIPVRAKEVKWLATAGDI